MLVACAAKQALKGKHEEDEAHLADEATDDPDPKQKLVRDHVCGGRGCVACHENLRGDVDDTNGAAESHGEVPQAGNTSGTFSGLGDIHGDETITEPGVARIAPGPLGSGPLGTYTWAMKTWGPLVLSLGTVLLGCGGGDGDGDGDGPPAGGECVTKAEEWRTCTDGALFECPAGDGAWADLELVQDCEDDGLACDDFSAECVDPSGSILGEEAAQYSATNESTDAPEETGYTLDEAGLSITGSWDGTRSFVFSTGEHERVNVQIFSDGVAQKSGTSTVTVTLDALLDDGLSTLSGGGYFINAYVTQNTDYVVAISGDGSDSEFEIQIQASVE